MKLIPLGKIASTTPGTPVPLAPCKGTLVRGLYLVALNGNTGVVYVGNSSLNKATLVGSLSGDGLTSGQTLDLTGILAELVGSTPWIDLFEIRMDVDTSGDAIGGFYVQ